MAHDPLMKELIKGFVDEAREVCQRVTRGVLELERATDAAAINKIMADVARGLHTLKGSSASLGLEQVSDLAHRMEDTLAPVRSEGSRLPSSTADALLKGLDTLLSAVAASAEDRAPDASAMANALQMLATSVGPEELQRIADNPSADRLSAPTASPSPSPAVPADPDESLSANAVNDADEWRVNTRHVLSMMKGIERLRELRARLDERKATVGRTLYALERHTMDPEDLRSMLSDLVRRLNLDAGEVSDSVLSLEDDLKSICTRPLRTIIDPLQRTVRDLCRVLDKEVRLSSVGAELALDRRLLEALKAPLMHLVRNAVDHGFETPAQRELAGKHREGVLVIRAEQIGNLLSLEVSDDGRGFDARRIAEVAVARGMLTANAAPQLSLQQTHQLVFRSGFSTRAEVTEISGRGVGLDVVKAQIEGMQGQVDVQSTAGQGTRFLLTVPLELGASSVLVTRCGEYEVGIPMNAIERLATTRENSVRVSRRRMELVVGDEAFPLVDLSAQLGLREQALPRPGQPAAIMQVDGERIAVALDGIEGDRELVIRPLPSEIRHIDAFQGTASAVDGQQILILRPNWLSLQRSLVEAPAERTRRVLVVDDSLTARALHRTILEAGGYVVHAVSSAAHALEQLSRNTYDALISDVSMEQMDGIELTGVLRADPRWRAMPVILVSAQEGSSERARGLAGGANAFLSKRECSEGKLLDEVSRVTSRGRDA